MPELAKETVALLGFLLPGFLVAWILYALTSLAKPIQLERVLQALVFTLFVRVLVFGEQLVLQFAGRWIQLRNWDTEAELVASLITALLLGLTGAHLVNTDRLHQWLRDQRISNRSSQPSEWCGVFCKYPTFVTLHYKDDRRLYGWPEVWPSDPEKGHFFIVFPIWLHGESPTPMPEVEGILVDVRDIKHVEFVKDAKEQSNGNKTPDTPSTTSPTA